MSTIKVTNIQDTSGNNQSTSEQLAYGRAKAWINFNGSGTVETRDDFNINSLTDNGTGDYTITFDTAFANNDYALVTNQRLDTSGGAPYILHTGNEHDDNTTTSARIICGNGNQNAAGSSGSAGDVSSIHVVVFGD